MSQPCIFITTHRIKEGKLDEFHRMAEGFVDFVELNAPRMLSLQTYLSDDETEVALVQIHPGAESMEFYLQIAADRIHQAFQVVDNLAVQIYGRVGNRTQALLEQVARSGVPVSVKPHGMSGFSRIDAGSSDEHVIAGSSSAADLVAPHSSALNRGGVRIVQ